MLIGASTKEIIRLKREYDDYYSLFCPEPNFNVCAHATNLERKILGTNNPEFPSTVKLPSGIFLTGSILDFSKKHYFNPDQIISDIQNTISMYEGNESVYIEYLVFDD